MTKRLKYNGAVVPMVTPFTVDGGLDGAALHRVVDALVDGGVDGVFAVTFLSVAGEAAGGLKLLFTGDAGQKQYTAVKSAAAKIKSLN